MPSRSTIFFLISAIASAGFKPFGHVLVQFIIVWQRYSLNGSSRSCKRSPSASSLPHNCSRRSMSGCSRSIVFLALIHSETVFMATALQLRMIVTNQVYIVMWSITRCECSDQSVALCSMSTTCRQSAYTHGVAWTIHCAPSSELLTTALALQL